MVLDGCHRVVALTVVLGVERDAGDECGVGAELAVLSAIVPCAAAVMGPVCQRFRTRSIPVIGPRGLDTAVVGCGWNGWLGSKVVSPVVAIVGRCPLDKRVGCEALPADRLVGWEGGIAQEG